MTQTYRALRVAPSDDGVLGVVIDAPPMNLIGPELVRDLVGLLRVLEADEGTRVAVLESADPDYFIPHVDLTRVARVADSGVTDYVLSASVTASQIAPFCAAPAGPGGLLKCRV